MGVVWRRYSLLAAVRLPLSQGPILFDTPNAIVRDLCRAMTELPRLIALTHTVAGDRRCITQRFS